MLVVPRLGRLTPHKALRGSEMKASGPWLRWLPDWAGCPRHGRQSGQLSQGCELTGHNGGLENKNALDPARHQSGHDMMQSENKHGQWAREMREGRRQRGRVWTSWKITRWKSGMKMHPERGHTADEVEGQQGWAAGVGSSGLLWTWMAVWQVFLTECGVEFEEGRMAPDLA